MWGDHGTKIIGGLGAVVTAVASVDPNVLTGLLGANAQNIVYGALSLLTILRGFQGNKLNGTPTQPK